MNLHFSDSIILETPICGHPRVWDELLEQTGDHRLVVRALPITSSQSIPLPYTTFNYVMTKTQNKSIHPTFTDPHQYKSMRSTFSSPQDSWLEGGSGALDS